MVNLTFSGPAEWSYQNNYDMKSMSEVLKIKLREVIREDKSGTYGVGVLASLEKYPEQRYNITIRFGCKPERVDELVNTVFQVIDSLKNYPVSDIYITKVKETQLREKEVAEKENKYWSGIIQKYIFDDMDWKQFTGEKDRIDNFKKESVIDAAKKYFDMNNYVKVVLYPEKT